MKVRRIISKDSKHLYGYIEEWGEGKGNLLVCLKQPHRINMAFDKYVTLAKKMDFAGIRIIFINTAINGKVPNNAKSAVIRNKALESSNYFAYENDIPQFDKLDILENSMLKAEKLNYEDYMRIVYNSFGEPTLHDYDGF